jgi:ABC-type lipoprotein release transport system permease subunit
MLVKLAWRNIWRNKRRTLITLASIFFAVILSTLMMSLKEGTYNKMIDSMIGSFMGFAQVQDADYFEDKHLDHSIIWNDTLEQILNSDRNVTGYSPRLESFALAASDQVTKGVMVVGIHPDNEKVSASLHEHVVEGEYLFEEDKKVLLGNGLADFLKVGINDTIILLGQGYHGTNAVGMYPVKGIVKFGSPELSKLLLFLPAQAAQWLFGAENMYTSVVLQLSNSNRSKQITKALSGKLDGNYNLLTWEELAPELKNMIETDRVEGYVFMFILYMVIAFGIFGTMIMMIKERMHEFGVMVAVGMKRLRLATIVWLEVIFISIIGAILGVIGAFPVCSYFYLYPIQFGEELGEMIEDYGMEAVLQSSIEPSIFIQQAIVIFLVACVVALFPFFRLMSLQAIDAMRS